MSETQKAWIKLIALIFGTGAAVCVTAIQGGAKPWIGILLGLGTAGTNVYHALSDKPASKDQNTTPTNEP